MSEHRYGRLNTLRAWVARGSIAVVIGVAGAVAVAPRAVDASAPPWSFFQGDTGVEVPASSTVAYGIGCVVGYLPVFVGYHAGSDSDFPDFQIYSEHLDVPDRTFKVSIHNPTTSDEMLTATTVCVSMAPLGPIQTAFANYPRSTQTSQAGGWARCPDGTQPIGGGEYWNQTGPGNITYAGPSDDGRGWYASGSTSVALNILHVEAYCIAAANLAGALYASFEAHDPATGQLAEVRCPPGTRFLTGGTFATLPGALGVEPYAYAGRMSELEPELDSGWWKLTAASPLDPPSGGVNESLTALCVPSSQPQATVMAGPPAVTDRTSATFGLDASDPVGYRLTAHCDLDRVRDVPCDVPSVSVSGLADGPHVFQFTVTNPDGRSATAAYHWTVDTTAPHIKSKAPSHPFTLANSTTVRWAGADSDGGTGIARYQLRERTARWNGTFGPWATRSSWRALPPSRTHVTARLRAGYDTCFEVRAVDRAGNASAWTAQRCTATPLDDRSLSRATTGWTRATGTNYYRRTFTTTTSYHAELRRTGARTDRIAVLATHCATCGKVAVYVGRRLVGTVNLHRSATEHQVLTALPAFRTRTATITLKVTSKREHVAIDGLGVSRT